MESRGSCFVCLMRPMVYFAKLRCGHSSGAIVRPAILPALTLYLAVTFHRHKKIRSVYKSIIILIYHFLLILIVFLVFIVTREVLEFHTGLYLFKYTAYFLYLGLIFLACEHMQALTYASMESRGSCFVCLMRPMVYFTYFSYGFAKLRCGHPSGAIVRPAILPDPRRWCFTLVLHLGLSAVTALTLYLAVTSEKCDYFAVFTTSELVSAQLGLVRLVLENAGWKPRLRQLQTMLCIWNYVGAFRKDRSNFLSSYRFSAFAIAFLATLNVLSVGYFLYGDITYLTFVNIFARLVMGLLLTSTYVYTLYEFIYYYLLFKWTFQQIQREIRRRLSDKVTIKKISSHPEGSGFLRRLKKLRRFYAILLYSFHRHKKTRSVYMSIIILIYHFLLILIVFLVFIVTRGVLEFHTGHLLYLFKYTAYFLYLGSIFVACEQMQALMQQTLTVMFKVPLNVLSPEEAREVEFFAKFLTWEQPNDSSKDMPVYKMNLLMNIVVDIITNSMVVIQLYFWFNKKG